MSQKKAQNPRSFQSIKSLPGDFRYIGDQGRDGMILSDISENVEVASNYEDTANGKGGDVGSDNDESPYYNMDMSAEDGGSLGENGDDIKDTNTPIWSPKQPHADSRWSDTTPYASKKVRGEFYIFL